MASLRKFFFLRLLQQGLERRPILKITLACLLVLLLAQTLIGTLSLSALNRLIIETNIDRVGIVANRLVSNIQNGLRLGKPLEQYFGLQDMLQSILKSMPDLQTISVVSVDGEVLATAGRDQNNNLFNPKAITEALVKRASYQNQTLENIHLLASGEMVYFVQHTLILAAPLIDAEKYFKGAIVLTTNKYRSAYYAEVIHNVKVLISVTVIIGILLASIFKYLLPLTSLATNTRARFAVPLIALMLAQGIYAANTITTFRQIWLKVTRENISEKAKTVQQDLNRLLGYGLKLERLHGLDKLLTHLLVISPLIKEIELLDASGDVLVRTNRTKSTLSSDTQKQHDLPNSGLSLSLSLSKPTLPAIKIQGELKLYLDEAVITAGIRSRIFDAVTVVIISLVTAGEMLLLLSLLMTRHFISSSKQLEKALKNDYQVFEVGRLVRLVMFSFLFVWALPLGFLPLYAKQLPISEWKLPLNIWLALPVSVEMACGLITALLAGEWTDRQGWRMPVLSGLILSAIGMLTCAVAETLLQFIFARGLVGLGYGLVWMGLQGCIVTCSAPTYRSRNMANLLSGIFAGHLCGAAVGAMLMEQLGFNKVFVIGCVALLFPLLGVVFLLQKYAHKKPSEAIIGADVSLSHFSSIPYVFHKRIYEALKLILTRNFGMLLLGSILPFSILQIGLLSFALPLYLEAQGASASTAGRVIMLYGLCMIYIGPLVAHFIDTSGNKKVGIVLGGVIGGLGMLGFYFSHGIGIAALAVFLLALSSCFSGSAQTPYMLSLDPVQKYGVSGAMGVMRAVDKLGQMLGPLIVGGLFGVVSMNASLALTGMIYLCASLVFLIFARNQG